MWGGLCVGAVEAIQGSGASNAATKRLPGQSRWPGWSYLCAPWGQVYLLIPGVQGVAAPAADLDSAGLGIERRCLLSSIADDLQLLNHLSKLQYVLCGSEQR